MTTKNIHIRHTITWKNILYNKIQTLFTQTFFHETTVSSTARNWPNPQRTPKNYRKYSQKRNPHTYIFLIQNILPRPGINYVKSSRSDTSGWFTRVPPYRRGITVSSGRFEKPSRAIKHDPCSMRKTSWWLHVRWKSNFAKERSTFRVGGRDFPARAFVYGIINEKFESVWEIIVYMGLYKSFDRWWVVMKVIWLVFDF